MRRAGEGDKMARTIRRGGWLTFVQMADLEGFAGRGSSPGDRTLTAPVCRGPLDWQGSGMVRDQAAT